MIRPSEYVDLLAREYLGSFIAEGGAAVKFVIPLEGATVQDVQPPLRRIAVDAGYLVADVDASRTRVHMIDQVFFQIARQIDWDALARTAAVRALHDLGFRVSEHAPLLDIDGIARDAGYAAAELRRDFNAKLQQSVAADFGMTREFRIAMMRLCQARVDPSGGAQTTRHAVLDWLTGELRRVSSLKPALIYQKITRANARHMLFSLAHWARRNDTRGIVLTVDIRALAVAKRADAGDDVFYTKPSVIDAYEVLRQLVDGTDEMDGMLIVVLCPEEFTRHEKGRGLALYQALQMRVYDEVRDRRRTNPLAAMVRLTPTAGAVAD